MPKKNSISALHTIEDLDTVSGGPTRSVLGLTNALTNFDVDVTLLTQNLNKQNFMSPSNIKSFITYNYNHKFTKNIGLTFKRGIFETIKKNNPCILHSHGIWLASNFWTSKASSHFNLPHIIHTRGMLSPWSISNKMMKKKIALFLYQKKNLVDAKILIATSKLEYNEIRNFGLSNPVAIIPNGIYFPKKDQINLDLEKKQKVKKLLFLSRIQKKKGLENLLNAWAKIKPIHWRLQIAGPNEDGHLDEIKFVAKKLKIENQIDYLGHVEDHLKKYVYQQADLFVLPSYSENFGVVVAEAMSFEVPVITTTGTPWNEINLLKCGWHIDIGVEPLALALDQALKMSDKDRKNMGKKAKEYVKKYDWNKIAQDMKLTYLWALNKTDKPAFIKLN
jgi:glycosyltransferase involved in cell wall biosynthesis